MNPRVIRLQSMNRERDPDLVETQRAFPSPASTNQRAERCRLTPAIEFCAKAIGLRRSLLKSTDGSERDQSDTEAEPGAATGRNRASHSERLRIDVAERIPILNRMEFACGFDTLEWSLSRPSFEGLRRLQIDNAAL